ncbi:GGDEF domain-containing protein [Phytohabitans kaempferiae]|uniref:GGDEF domain-containing protein n=1 Tax=Phytohabitans kaempferiae TaxID=1620943 RepID=A0ABV6M8H2_9ACTN
MRILDPAAADTGGAPPIGGQSRTEADTARLQARIDQLEAHVQRLEQERVALRWMAGHDALTGLANRRLFHALAPTLLRGEGRSSAIVILDLNGFKPINDTYGHDAGDEVLCVIARRMAACLGDHLVARFGGDEFAALVTAPRADASEAWWHEVAASLSAAISPPIDVAGRELAVTASIGLVPAGRPTDLAELLRRADQAMFQAKRHTRTTGKVSITWVVATEGGDRAVTYEPSAPPAVEPSAPPAVEPSAPPAVEPSAPPAAAPPAAAPVVPGTAPAVLYRSGDPVWVHRDGMRRAGVVEGASEWAALVRYRCSDGAGTMVDTMPADCLAIRAVADPHLDREPSEP